MIYEVWNEGYAATGEHSVAQYLGLYNGETFKDAVIAAITDKQWDVRLFNPDRLTYWGCKFFDNEKDARKNFG